MVKKNYDFETRAIHAHQFKNQYNAVTLPIYRTSTFGFDSTEQGGRCFAGEEEGYIYTRLSNPTNRALEQIVASLEGGEDCVAFGSGMAATASLILHLCSAGDNVIYNTTIYGGTMGLAKETLPKYNIGARFFTGDSMGELESLIDESARPPIVRAVDLFIYNALKKRASDIHVEPYQDRLVIKYRIDGSLHEEFNFPKKNQQAVIARLKIISSLDITESRLPQDGRFKVEMNKEKVSFSKRGALRAKIVLITRRKAYWTP